MQALMNPKRTKTLLEWSLPFQIFPYLSIFSMDHDGYRWDAMVYKWHKLLHPPMFWSTVLNRSLPALWCEIWCRQVSHNYEQGQQLLQSREFSTRRRQKPTAVFRFFWGISWRIFQEFMGFSWDFQANVRVWPWDGWFFLDFVKIHYSKMLLKTCYLNEGVISHFWTWWIDLRSLLLFRSRLLGPDLSQPHGTLVVDIPFFIASIHHHFGTINSRLAESPTAALRKAFFQTVLEIGTALGLWFWGEKPWELELKKGSSTTGAPSFWVTTGIRSTTVVVEFLVELHRMCN